jgi:hypothetical protein
VDRELRTLNAPAAAAPMAALRADREGASDRKGKDLEMSNDEFDLLGFETPNNGGFAAIVMSAENGETGYSAAVYMYIPRTNP